MQDSLGSLEEGAGFPREFEMAVQGNFKWGCRIPMIRRGAIFLKGNQILLRGAEFSGSSFMKAMTVNLAGMIQRFT